MTAAPAPPASTRSAVATAALFSLALAAGAAMPLQGRLNSALAVHTGSAVLAALASFATGLAVMAAATAALPAGRRAARRVVPALRSGRVRWWQMSAGVVGASLIFGQAFTIPVIGVAVFTVAVVTGQVVGGMVLDRLGWTPAGVQRLTARRLVGAALALAAVVAVVWPQLADVGGPGGAAGAGGAAATGVGTWVLLALLPLVGGMLTSGQQVMNGAQTSVYGSPLPATLINFAAGTAVLTAVHGALTAASGPAGPLPGLERWWLYLGGPLGCCFVALAAFLVPRVGALLTTLGLVAGQLLGSLALDLAAPTPGTHVTALTVLGTAGALVAVAVSSAPPTRRTRVAAEKTT